MNPPDLKTIPRGNTCHGVNHAVFEHLVADGRDLSRSALLDVPCGDETFVKFLRSTFPRARVVGCDRRLPAGGPDGAFATVNAARPFSLGGEQFDVVCCISGVMEFDNTLQFFESCRSHLKDDGVFIVTNDNIASARDRLTFLALGKTRRFELFADSDRPTWKVLPIQNLLRLLHDAGFSVRSIRYVPVRAKDWLLLPFALLLWPGQWLYATFARGTMPVARRRMLFPFISLLSRHYVVACAPAP